MKNKVDQWLSNLSSRFGEQKWRLDGHQCRLNDEGGVCYLVMEWLPKDNLLLLAFPLGDLQTEGLNSEEKMFELLSLNAHAELVGKAWLALGDGGEEYFLMSTINVELSDYQEFEKHWFEINDLSKLIQFAITSKMPMLNPNLTEQTVRA